jgi:hypothetical protein
VDILTTLVIVFLFSTVSAMMAAICYGLEIYIRERFIISRKVEIEREKIDIEKTLSAGLLLNMFPRVIIEKFNNDKSREASVVEEFPEVTIFFSDIVSFTELSSKKTPTELVGLLNDLFSRFDTVCAQYNLEKIKTIGEIEKKKFKSKKKKKH